MLHLPITPSLSTFGYPEDVSDIESKTQLLKLMQRYNKAIVQTAEVVHWMIFITVFWLVPTLISMIKKMRLENPMPERTQE